MWRSHREEEKSPHLLFPKSDGVTAAEGPLMSHQRYLPVIPHLSPRPQDLEVVPKGLYLLPSRRRPIIAERDMHLDPARVVSQARIDLELWDAVWNLTPKVIAMECHQVTLLAITITTIKMPIIWIELQASHVPSTRKVPNHEKRKRPILRRRGCNSKMTSSQLYRESPTNRVATRTSLTWCTPRWRCLMTR